MDELESVFNQIAPGFKAKVIEEFEAEQRGDLTIKTGAILTIKTAPDSNGWTFVRRGEETGFAPVQCLEPQFKKVSDRFLGFCIENAYDSETILDDLKDDDFGPCDDHKDSNLYPVLDQNKFLVKLIKKHLGGNMNDDDEITEFSFGENMWYFWSYFKDGSNFNVAKYKNLKEECLNNGIHQMSMERFNEILVESIMFLNTTKGRCIKAMDRGGDNDQYNIS